MARSAPAVGQKGPCQDGAPSRLQASQVQRELSPADTLLEALRLQTQTLVAALAASPPDATDLNLACARFRRRHGAAADNDGGTDLANGVFEVAAGGQVERIIRPEPGSRAYIFEGSLSSGFANAADEAVSWLYNDLVLGAASAFLSRRVIVLDRDDRLTLRIANTSGAARRYAYRFEGYVRRTTKQAEGAD